MGKIRFKLLVTVSLFVAGGVAQAGTLYITQYNGSTGAIVDTDSETLINNFTTTVSTETGIAVDDTIRIIAGFPSNAGSEYDLSGATVNTGIYPNNAYSSLYDGTTDGLYNYAIDHNGNGNRTVFRFDRNWQNPTALFQTTQRSSGIAYDSLTNTLWTTGGSGAPDGAIQQYSMDGVLLDEVSTAAIGGLHYGLAFDPTDGTLWTSRFGTGVLSQLDLSGNLLRQFTIPGTPLINAFGLEFGFQAISTGTARFQITKTFTNGSTGDVEITLTCNGGLPLEQSFTISGDGPGVTFTVNNLPDAGVDCEVMESGGPDGYTNNADACSWTGVVGGLRTCAITNTPEPSEFAVEIDFDMIEDPAIDLGWDLEVVCTPAADAADDTIFPGVTFNESGTGSDEFLFTFYADPEDGSDCTATLSGLSSAIEQDGACTIEEIAVGEANDPDTDESETPTCTITATAFYEGIPTLGQYGLALMALLMLGVGFVGFRRFV
ncbi:MAG: IPTL-CTERM sorting domain-containing protein [Xanthomonadales bacterium]|nr:IPTL-CTERM sorting domain-containing protein [Xanthomonadales bacterium]